MWAHSPGSRWEATVGYSRAGRVGNVVEVAGTAAQAGEHVTGSDEYVQPKRVLEKIAVVAA